MRRCAESSGGRLLRINPQAEPALPAGAVHLRCGALEGIAAIHAAAVARLADRAAQAIIR